MSRLIDADYFKEQIVAVTLKNNIDTDKAIPLLELIDAIPTAYDIEKVVAELPTYEFGVSLLNTEKYVKLSDLKKKIDAIRKGGVE